MQIAGFEIEQPVRGQLLSAVNAAQQRDFDELMANDDGTETLSRIHALPGCETDTLEQYVPLETVYVDDDNASVLCYSEPIDPDTVASITAYRYTYLGDAASDTSGIGGYELTDTTVIYQG